MHNLRPHFVTNSLWYSEFYYSRRVHLGFTSEPISILAPDCTVNDWMCKTWTSCMQFKSQAADLQTEKSGYLPGSVLWAHSKALGKKCNIGVAQGFSSGDTYFIDPQKPNVPNIAVDSLKNCHNWAELCLQGLQIDSNLPHMVLLPGETRRRLETSDIGMACASFQLHIKEDIRLVRIKWFRIQQCTRKILLLVD